MFDYNRASVNCNGAIWLLVRLIGRLNFDMEATDQSAEMRSLGKARNGLN